MAQTFFWIRVYRLCVRLCFPCMQLLLCVVVYWWISRRSVIHPLPIGYIPGTIFADVTDFDYIFDQDYQWCCFAIMCGDFAKRTWYAAHLCAFTRLQHVSLNVKIEPFCLPIEDFDLITLSSRYLIIMHFLNSCFLSLSIDQSFICSLINWNVRSMLHRIR